MDFILDWQLGLSFELVKCDRQFYSNSYFFRIFHLWISLLILISKCTLRKFNWNTNRHLLSSLNLFFYCTFPHFPPLKSFPSSPYALVTVSPWLVRLKRKLHTSVCMRHEHINLVCFSQRSIIFPPYSPHHNFLLHSVSFISQTLFGWLKSFILSGSRNLYWAQAWNFIHRLMNIDLFLGKGNFVPMKALRNTIFLLLLLLHLSMFCTKQGPHRRGGGDTVN